MSQNLIQTLSDEDYSTLLSLKGLWKSNAKTNPPDLSTLTQQGYPGEGNPGRGESPTNPGSAWFYLTDLVRLSVIWAAGETPEVPPSPTQFIRCLKKVGQFMNDKTLSYNKLKDEVFGTLDEVKAGAASKLVTASILKQYIEGYKFPYSVPTGTIIHTLAKTAPGGYLELDGSETDREDSPALVEHIWSLEIEEFMGDGSTYCVLPDIDGRVVQGTTDESQVGKYLEAQLPNMVSKMAWPYMGITYQDNRYSLTGAFYQTTEKLNDNASFNGNADRNQPNLIGFDPSRVSDLYSGNTLQPNALQTLCCIKI